jgi:hypothetical protein
MKKILFLIAFLNLNLIPCYSMEKIDKAMIDRANRQMDENRNRYKEKERVIRAEVWEKLYVGMPLSEFMHLFGKYVTKESGDYVYFSIPNVAQNSRVKFIEGNLIKYEVVARSYGIPGTGYYQDSTNLLENGN